MAAAGDVGIEIDLDKIPLREKGMEPWEIMMSESQERMTLAVPPGKIDGFIDLMKRRGVEATIIGTFNDSGRGVVRYNTGDRVKNFTFTEFTNEVAKDTSAK
jgi:phosphoribosylformylglycinamidine synthase